MAKNIYDPQIAKKTYDPEMVKNTFALQQPKFSRFNMLRSIDYYQAKLQIIYRIEKLAKKGYVHVKYLLDRKDG